MNLVVTSSNVCLCNTSNVALEIHNLNTAVSCLPDSDVIWDCSSFQNPFLLLGKQSLRACLEQQ